MRRLRTWIAALALLLVLVLGGFVAWASMIPAPGPEALAALKADPQVQVDTDPWLAFHPAGGDPSTGLILYPGGRVDPRAYAPAAHTIAAQGYRVVIVPMPLNLAVFGVERASQVQAAFPQVQHWAIGGHSLGGAMAANFAYRHPGAVEGLVLWAAYPAANNDLSSQNLTVTSIYGTQDGLATGEKIAASRPLLPADTRWVAIEGGNHAQFGWYGPQQGDNPATISREEQQQQVVAATLDLLAQLEE